MIGSLAKNIKDFRVPKFGNILVKCGRLWLKGSIKSHHEHGWKFCTQTFGGRIGWTFLIRGLPITEASTSTAKGLDVSTTYGIALNKTFIHGREHKRNLGSLI